MCCDLLQVLHQPSSKVRSPGIEHLPCVQTTDIHFFLLKQWFPGWLSLSKEWARPLCFTEHRKKALNKQTKPEKLDRLNMPSSSPSDGSARPLLSGAADLNGRHNCQSLLTHRFQQKSHPAMHGHPEGHQGVSQLPRLCVNLDRSHCPAAQQRCSTCDAPHHQGGNPSPCPSAGCPKSRDHIPAGKSGR